MLKGSQPKTVLTGCSRRVRLDLTGRSTPGSLPMEKALSPTRAERLLRVFKRIAVDMRDAGLSRQLIGDVPFTGDSISLNGDKVLNFGLCSSLGLGDDPRLKASAKEAVDRFGTSYSSSVAYTAVPLYHDLRERMREIFGAHVVLTGTTTLGHLTALPVLVMPGDRVLVDSQTHSSVLTATQTLQASGVSVSSLSHNDMIALESAVEQDNGSRRIWYLTDGVFSMGGDTSPAETLAALQGRHENLYLYVDDAHGFGWAGLHGRGQFLARFPWNERTVVATGLSKTFGALGGAIVTPNADFAETVELCGPALTFGGPIPPPSLGAGVAAADIFLSDEIIELQDSLMERIRLVNEISTEMGLEFSHIEETPLWFYDVGSASRMMELAASMRDSGFFLNGASFPAVAQGHAGVRFTVTLYLTNQQIEDMLICMNEKRLELFGETEVIVDVDSASGVSRSADH